MALGADAFTVVTKGVVEKATAPAGAPGQCPVRVGFHVSVGGHPPVRLDE